MFNLIDKTIKNWLIDQGLSSGLAQDIADFSGFLLVLVLALISFYVLKKLIARWAHILTKKTKSDWDDKLLERRVFHRLAYLAPALIILYLTPYVIPSRTFIVNIIQALANIYIFTIGMLVLFSFLDAVNDVYQSYYIAKKRPIKSFLQVIKIIIAIIYIVMVINILFIGEGNFGWLAGMGAFSAVLLLVFKDPILGFVGGLQLAFNDMLRIGDWIEMEKYGADGTVTEISITTVKVQNWNKTISTIPTYALVADSYKNWRGMEESGGRRIKRSILVDMTSIKFCDHEMLDRFSKFENIKDYVTSTEDKIREYNDKKGIDNSILVNGRRQTNIGVFRAYLKGYLRNHQNVNQDMTFLVRQLQPTEKGIPMEVYVFSKVQSWADYEDIQSDIFDHIMAVIPQFDLKVYQYPSGNDFRTMTDADL